MRFLGFLFYYTHLEKKDLLEFQNFLEQFQLKMKVLSEKGQFFFSQEIKNNFTGGFLVTLIINSGWDLRFISKFLKSIRKQYWYPNRLSVIGFLFQFKNEIIVVTYKEFHFLMKNLDYNLVSSYNNVNCCLIFHTSILLSNLHTIQISKINCQSILLNIQSMNLMTTRGKFF